MPAPKHPQDFHVTKPERKKSRINHRSGIDISLVFSGLGLFIDPISKARLIPAIRSAVKVRAASVSPANRISPESGASREPPITASVDLRSPHNPFALVSLRFPPTTCAVQKRSPFYLSISNCRFSPWRARRLNFPALCFTATVESADYR